MNWKLEEVVDEDMVEGWGICEMRTEIIGRTPPGENRRGNLSRIW